MVDDYEFFVCPLSFLSSQIKFWYKKYKLIKDQICKPLDYVITINKFFEAVNIYEFYLSKFQNDKQTIDKNDKALQQLSEIKHVRKN